MLSIQNIQYSLEYPVILPEHHIAYWPTPKNACTSLKYAFYRLRTGTQFTPLFKVQGRYLYHIHKVLPSRPFRPVARYKHWLKVAVIRDPLERLISSYCNRILHHQDLAKHRHELKTLGLESQPTFKTFVNHLHDYRKISTLIRDHTDPQVFFLGEDPNYFDRLVEIKQLKDLAHLIHCPNLTLPMTQDGGRQFKKQILNEIDHETKDQIFKFYQKDYSSFGTYFQSSEITATTLISDLAPFQ